MAFTLKHDDYEEGKLVTPPTYATPPDEGSRLILKTKDIIKDIERFLRGEMVDESGKIIPVGRRLANENGIRNILSWLVSFLNKNNILTQYTEHDINSIMRSLDINISIQLAMNYKDWGIEFSDLDMVHDIIIYNIYATLKRSLGGKTLESLTQHIMEERVVYQQPKGGRL